MTNGNVTEVETPWEGPFGVAPVDALVFRRTSDAPELRAAAALLNRQVETFRLEAPVRHVEERQEVWFPDERKPEVEQVRKLNRVVRAIAGFFTEIFIIALIVCVAAGVAIYFLNPSYFAQLKHLAGL